MGVSVSGVLCKLVLLSVPCSGCVMQWMCVLCTQGGLSVVPLQNGVLSALLFPHVDLGAERR